MLRRRLWTLRFFVLPYIYEQQEVHKVCRNTIVCWSMLLRYFSVFLIKSVFLSQRYRPEHHCRPFRQHSDRRHVSYPALRDLRSSPPCHHLAERWRTRIPHLPFSLAPEKNILKAQAVKLPGCTSPRCLSDPLLYRFAWLCSTTSFHHHFFTATSGSHMKPDMRWTFCLFMLCSFLCPFLISAGERVLASGSVQLPRFTLLESGSLLISPSHISDVGTYTCMASNSRGIDEASADLVVWGECVWRVFEV